MDRRCELVVVVEHRDTKKPRNGVLSLEDRIRLRRFSRDEAARAMEERAERLRERIELLSLRD